MVYPNNIVYNMADQKIATPIYDRRCSKYADTDTVLRSTIPNDSPVGSWKVFPSK